MSLPGWALFIVLCAGLLAVGWWFRRRLLAVTVQGNSMLPTYRDGDLLLVSRTRRRPEAGQVVVTDLPPLDQASLARLLGGATAQPGSELPTESAQAPSPAWVRSADSVSRVVKRVVAGPGEPTPVGTAEAASVVPPGKLVLRGDNAAESIDSRHYGFVSSERLVGVVVRRLR